MKTKLYTTGIAILVKNYMNNSSYGNMLSIKIETFNGNISFLSLKIYCNCQSIGCEKYIWTGFKSRICMYSKNIAEHPLYLLFWQSILSLLKYDFLFHMNYSCMLTFFLHAKPMLHKRRPFRFIKHKLLFVL